MFRIGQQRGREVSLCLCVCVFIYCYIVSYEFWFLWLLELTHVQPEDEMVLLTMSDGSLGILYSNAVVPSESMKTTLVGRLILQKTESEMQT